MGRPRLSEEHKRQVRNAWAKKRYRSLSPEVKAVMLACNRERKNRWYANLDPLSRQRLLDKEHARYLALPKGPIQAANRRWRMENPKNYLLAKAKHRAKKAGIPFSITVDDFEIPDFCPVFGTPLLPTAFSVRDNMTPSLDRIDPLKGYIPGNVVVVSWRANQIKRDATPYELLCLAAFYGSKA